MAAPAGLHSYQPSDISHQPSALTAGGRELIAGQPGQLGRPSRGRAVSFRGGRWVAQGALAAAAALGVTLVGADDPVTTAVLVGAGCGVLVASGVGLVVYGADDERPDER